MIITTNLLTLPFVLLLWLLDTWGALLAARLVLRHVPTPWAGRASAALASFTDGALMRSHRWGLRLWPALPFSWTGPLILVGCLILKQALLRLLVGMT